MNDELSENEIIQNHWFLGQTTPFALLVDLASTGNSQRAVLVPNTCTKFS